jgi:hypothetical protein
MADNGQFINIFNAMAVFRRMDMQPHDCAAQPTWVGQRNAPVALYARSRAIPAARHLCARRPLILAGIGKGLVMLKAAGTGLVEGLSKKDL